MADIQHCLQINAPVKEVYHAVSTPEGLDAWWTLQCVGKPEGNAHYRLYFGPGYDWKAEVSQCSTSCFELTLYSDDPEWNGTKVTFELSETSKGTKLDFTHSGWPDTSEHYRISSYCWAVYLRLLKRFVEKGEVVSYEKRLD
jgi:uncharacterized protein YndB with AHSA1/START domain